MTLDKKNRAALCSFSQHEQVSLVLPHLNAWAGQVLRASRVVDLMEQHLACLHVPEPSSSSTPWWKLKRLSRALRDICFARLMQICSCSKLEPIQSAFLELRHSYGEQCTD